MSVDQVTEEGAGKWTESSEGITLMDGHFSAVDDNKTCLSQ